MCEEKNFNDQSELIRSIKKYIKRFHYCMRKGIIYFSDKNNDEVQFSQLLTKEIKEELEQERENKK